MRPLLPTLREKHRYLVFEVLSNSKIRAFSAVAKAIMQSSLSFSGTLGVADSGLRVLKWDAQRQRGMLRVNARGLPHTRASLIFVKDIEKKPVAVRTVGVSGILRKAESKYIAG